MESSDHKMDSSTIKRLILVCFLAVFFFSSENNIVKAAPKIRASKGQVDTSSNGVRNSNNQMSCYETIPCGWALYSTEEIVRAVITCFLFRIANNILPLRLTSGVST